MALKIDDRSTHRWTAFESIVVGLLLHRSRRSVLECWQNKGGCGCGLGWCGVFVMLKNRGISSSTERVFFYNNATQRGFGLVLVGTSRSSLRFSSSSSSIIGYMKSLPTAVESVRSDMWYLGVVRGVTLPITCIFVKGRLSCGEGVKGGDAAAGRGV